MDNYNRESERGANFKETRILSEVSQSKLAAQDEARR